MSKTIYKILALYIIFSSIPLGFFVLYSIYEIIPEIFITISEGDFDKTIEYIFGSLFLLGTVCLPFLMQIAAGIGILKEKPWTRNVLSSFPVIGMFIIPIVLFAFGHGVHSKLQTMLLYGILFTFINYFFLIILLNLIFSIEARIVKDQNLDFRRAAILELWSFLKKFLFLIIILIVAFICMAIFVIRS
ncbi:MAG: hypothetical protein KBD53_08725 [Candidatus Omnitrophica bacterium]|nr:hypothetical protein [Candidatus Omnitrophota bacterium]